MRFAFKASFRLSLIAILFVGVCLPVVAQRDIAAGTSVFVYKKPRKFFGNVAVTRPAVKQTQNARRTTAAPAAKGTTPPRAEPEPDAPESWVNENADNAIEERKVSDEEPFLSLSSGYLNSRYTFCESPEFPTSMKGKKRLVTSKVLVTVGKYGGLLEARAVEGDPQFRAAVYKTLGSMQFRQSFFMGQPVRIEGELFFSQNPANTVLCRESAQDLEIPAIIDGGVLNEFSKGCQAPEFPADAKSANLKSVSAKVEIVVDENGKVTEAKAIEGHASFGALAAQSALKAAFPKSAITNKLVKVRGIMNFTQTPANDARCGA